MVAEQTHRYPRWMTWTIEFLCALLVGVAAFLAGRDLLLFLWTYTLDLTLSRQFPWLTDLVLNLGGGANGRKIYELSGLLPSLAWLLLALLLALLARNSLPTIRTSPRGMLVEFAGNWLPIPWESLSAIKVTEDFGAERFVLLAETGKEQLTGWHRLYSFLYRFGLRRSFLVTSAISNFDGLVQTLLSETDRVARVLDKTNSVKLQEDASSPLFRFLLGPASFFSRRDTAEVAVTPDVAATATGTLHGAYPARISGLFIWGTALLALVAIVRYIVYWLEFAAVISPSLLRLPVFDRLSPTAAQQAAPWWVLVAAHLMLLVVFTILIALRHTLPELEARRDGLAVRHFSRWLLLPWERIMTIKVTELSENSQIVLIQASGGLPLSARFASLIYEGSFKPGVLLTSAISGFEPLLQRTVLEVTRHQNVQGDIEGSPLFQSEAYSPLLYTSLRGANAIDRQIEDSRETNETTEFKTPLLLRSAGIMFWIALMPALLALADRAIRQAIVPLPFLFVAIAILFVLGMLEWPVVALAASTYDDMSGGGEEGNRPFYLYPATQLPRVIPLAFAIVFTLLGVPVLPILLWLTAIGWSFLLAAGLWSTLYDWRGSQLVVGGLVPVIFQLLLLLAYLFVLG